MNSEQVQQMFLPGVQFNVNELQAGKGSGLGLFIAKGICEHHHGSLTAASDGIGCGTSITVTLPLYHVPDEVLPESLKHRLQLDKNGKMAQQRNNTGTGGTDDNDSKHSNLKHQTDSSVSTSGNNNNESLRILVVDDAAMNRKILTRLLTNRGHVCDQAENGEEAVRLVKESLLSTTDNNNRDESLKSASSHRGTYDTILLDYEMPVMNGPDAARQIRDLGCDSFIIGITGNVLPDDQAHFKQSGANWVFPKPVKIEDLKSVWLEYGITRR